MPKCSTRWTPQKARLNGILFARSSEQKERLSRNIYIPLATNSIAGITMTKTMLVVDSNELVTKSTAAALFTLIEAGLPKTQALTKLGINKSLSKQIDKIAEKYIGYYSEGEEVYQEKISRNSERMQKYIEACIDTYITCERADAEFAALVTESIVSGISENPELALKVAERRWANEWAPKRETNVKVDTTSTIKTIQITVPEIETVDADYEVMNENDS